MPTACVSGGRALVSRGGMGGAGRGIWMRGDGAGGCAPADTPGTRDNTQMPSAIDVRVIRLDLSNAPHEGTAATQAPWEGVRAL